MAANTFNILSLNTASTSVTTGAYVQISAAGGTPIPTALLVITNNTSSIIKVATGAAGSEVDLVAVLPTSVIKLPLGAVLPAGTRVSLEALDSTASSKFVSVSLMP